MRSVMPQVSLKWANVTPKSSPITHVRQTEQLVLCLQLVNIQDTIATASNGVYNVR